ncbi:MAG TPA: hypothetical protein DCQ29_11010 [Chitinophagaceae bacterium]|nr:hypothetical protein [Chitinophagaceae bacterium]
MDRPLISIVIPTYNRAFCIEATINSVLQQSYSNLEILIIDDQSTDNTGSLIENQQRKDNRIRYFAHIENKGVSEARNTGIRNARGKYLIFLDSDDLFHRNYLHSFVGQLSVNNPDIVFCNFNLSSNNVNVANKKPVSDIRNLKKTLIDGSQMNQIGSIIWKMDFLVSKRLSFLQGLNIGEDRLFIIKALLKKPIVNFGNFESVIVKSGDWDSLTRNYLSKKNKLAQFRSKLLIQITLISSPLLFFRGIKPLLITLYNLIKTYKK